MPEPTTYWKFGGRVGGSVGPDEPAPEDHPEQWVELSPSHPGAFSWIDSRTLMFRPVEPWPPLTRFEWTVDGRRFALMVDHGDHLGLWVGAVGGDVTWFEGVALNPLLGGAMTLIGTPSGD